MDPTDFWAATRALRRTYDRLWLLDHGARTATRRETRFTRRRLEQHQRLVEQALGLGHPGPRLVERVSGISPAEFGRRWLDTDTPVVLAGAGRDWPASRWTPELLGERYAGSTVRLLRAAPNQPRGRPGEGRDATYADIAESMREGGDLYARFSGLLHQHPELIDDLDVTWFRDMRHDHRRFENWGFFMGGAGTATGLHSSIAPNLFYQITGNKRWYLFPPASAPYFAPPVKCSPYFYSEVDVTDPVRWPIAAAIPGWIADLQPGDVLYVPSFAWHQVHNATPTLAVGYRWLDLRLGLRASRLQTLLAATCTNPPPWRTKGHADLPTLLDAIDY